MADTVNYYNIKDDIYNYRSFRASYMLQYDFKEEIRLYAEFAKNVGETDINLLIDGFLKLEKDSPKSFHDIISKVLKLALSHPEWLAIMAFTGTNDGRETIFVSEAFENISKLPSTSILEVVPDVVANIFGPNHFEKEIATILLTMLSGDSRETVLDRFKECYWWLYLIADRCKAEGRPFTVNDVLSERSRLAIDIEALFCIPFICKLEGCETDPGLLCVIAGLLYQMAYYSRTYVASCFNYASADDDIEEIVCKLLKISMERYEERIRETADKMSCSPESIFLSKNMAIYGTGRSVYIPDTIFARIATKILATMTSDILYAVYCSSYFPDPAVEFDETSLTSVTFASKQMANSVLYDYFEDHLPEVITQAIQTMLECNSIHEEANLFLNTYFGFSTYVQNNRPSIEKESILAENRDCEEDLKAEIRKLRHEIESLKYDVGRRDARIQSLEDKISNQTAQAEAELGSDENQEDDVVSVGQVIKRIGPDDAQAILNGKRCCVIGGHENWQNKLKLLFPEWKFVLADESTSVPDSFAGYDAVYVYTKHLAHKTFNQTMRALRGSTEILTYLSSTNMDQTLADMAESFCRP